MYPLYYCAHGRYSWIRLRLPLARAGALSLYCTVLLVSGPGQLYGSGLTHFLAITSSRGTLKVEFIVAPVPDPALFPRRVFFWVRWGKCLSIEWVSYPIISELVASFVNRSNPLQSWEKNRHRRGQCIKSVQAKKRGDQAHSGLILCHGSPPFF